MRVVQTVAVVMADQWTPLDEGIWRGIQVRLRVESGDWLPDLGPRPDLGSGERLLIEQPGRIYEFTYTPGTDGSYRRVRVNWARDPLMAPVWALLVAPVNLVSWAIATSRSQPRQRTVSHGETLLRITDRALAVSWQGQWRYYDASSIKYYPREMPDSLCLLDIRQRYFLRLGVELAPTAYMTACVTFGRYQHVGVTPAFRERAARFGRNLPEHVAYHLFDALDAYGSYGSGGPR